MPTSGGLRRKVPPAHVRELLDVVGPDVARARLEGDDVAQLLRRDLLGHHPDQRPAAIGDGRDHAIDDRHRRRDQRRGDPGVERREERAQGGADEEPERELDRPQPQQSEQPAADDRHRQRRVDHEPQQPAEQRHQQGAADDAVPERLRRGGASAQGRVRLDGGVHRRADQRARHRADPVDRDPEDCARSGPERRAPDQRVEPPAGAAALRPAHAGTSAAPASRISSSPSASVRNRSVTSRLTLRATART